MKGEWTSVSFWWKAFVLAVIWPLWMTFILRGVTAFMAQGDCSNHSGHHCLVQVVYVNEGIGKWKTLRQSLEGDCSSFPVEDPSDGLVRHMINDVGRKVLSFIFKSAKAGTVWQMLYGQRTHSLWCYYSFTPKFIHKIFRRLHKCFYAFSVIQEWKSQLCYHSQWLKMEKVGERSDGQGGGEWVSWHKNPTG